MSVVKVDTRCEQEFVQVDAKATRYYRGLKNYQHHSEGSFIIVIVKLYPENPILIN